MTDVTLDVLCPVCRRRAFSMRETVAGNERTRVWDHGRSTCQASEPVVAVDRVASAQAIDPRIGRGA